MTAKTKLYGVREIADALGVSREVVSQWLFRGKVPKPDAELAMGPVWTHDTLKPWLRRQRRDLKARAAS